MIVIDACELERLVRTTFPQKPGFSVDADLGVARAEAAYLVAREKCDDLAGNVKDVCVKEAKAAETKAKADTKADRKVADARKDAAERSTDARKDAAETKRDADYRVAVERCDSLASDAKDACVRDAKARFGKS